MPSLPTLTTLHIGTHNGESVYRYEITASSGMRVALLNWGATIQELFVPDASGNLANVVLGFNNLRQYLQKHPHFGTVVGRYANRIGGCQFELDGETHHLTPNKGTFTAHGGARPFDQYVWSAEEIDGEFGPGVKMTHISPDGDEGFPGELTATVTYSLTAENGLRLDYTAATTKPTIVNLTNHAYFNMGGEASGVVDNHILHVPSTHYTPTGNDQVPTGEIAPVRGAALDFMEAKPLRAALRDGHDPQIRIARGIDHNYVVTTQPDGALREAASITDPVSGRSMTVLTTMPGIQIYTGNSLDGSLPGYSGVLYRQSDAVCFETQQFPDAPNHEEFPSPVLRPGDEFTSSTIYQFSAV